jgi:hypothetical protein
VPLCSAVGEGEARIGLDDSGEDTAGVWNVDDCNPI